MASWRGFSHRSNPSKIAMVVWFFVVVCVLLVGFLLLMRPTSGPSSNGNGGNNDKEDFFGKGGNDKEDFFGKGSGNDKEDFFGKGGNDTMWVPTFSLPNFDTVTAESVDLSGDGVSLVMGSTQANNNQGRVDMKAYYSLKDIWYNIVADPPITGDQEGENFGHVVQVNRIGHILLASGFGSFEKGVKGIVRSYTLQQKLPQSKQQYWVQFGGDLTGETVGDRFGIALSMDSMGTAFIVGADGGDDNNDNNDDLRNGYAKVYQFNEEMMEWQAMRNFVGEDGSRLGNAVAMSGDGTTVCIGEVEYRILGETKPTGRVRCYNGKDWMFRQGQELIGTHSGGSFGYSLSLNEDGTILAVGDRLAGPNQEGSVTAYKYRKEQWRPRGQELSTSGGNDEGGFQCKLNALGNVLAWSAPGYDKENDEDVGLVRVVKFNKSNKQWELLGDDIEGDRAGGFFGESVTMSDTGTFLAASSNRNAGSEYIKILQLK